METKLYTIKEMELLMLCDLSLSLITPKKACCPQNNGMRSEWEETQNGDIVYVTYYK